MEEKLRVLLVIGKGQSYRMLDLFEPLSDVWDMSVATFLQDLRKSTYFSQIPIKSFIEDQHMPAYMRGLEEEIAKADLVFGIGCTDPINLQTLRSCHAHEKPLIIYFPDAESLKSEQEDDEFSRKDVLAYARAFLSCDAEATDYLQFLGVDPAKILSLSPRISHSRLGYQPQLRDKFRAYIKLAPEDFLVLCADSLESYSRTTGLLMAVKYLVQKHPAEAAGLRVLFTGTGPAKEQLKYLAVDAGIAKHIIFISQDTAPFLRDLYSAADLGVSLSSRQRSLGQESSTFWVLEGMACGLRPLIDQHHPLSTALTADCSVTTDDFEDLALGLKRALENRYDPAYSRRAISDLCRFQFDASDCKEHLLGLIERTLQTQTSAIHILSRDFAELSRTIKAEWGREEDSVVLEKIEEGLRVWDHHPEHKAQLQLVKAQVYLKAGDIESALNSFELCTSEHSVQREAYIGLGRIAYLTSAQDEALSFYRKALAIKPNDPEAMAGLGHVYRKALMADDAVYWFAKSLSVESNNTAVLLALTQACLEAEDVPIAIASLEQLQTMVGEKAPVVMALGQLYYKQGDFQKGRLMVDQAMAISDSTPGIWKVSPSNVG